MNIIVVVHNQRELLVQWLDKAMELQIDFEHLVIVDNFSQDGLGEELKNTSYNYVLCDEKIEAYSVIVNMVVREFEMSGQVYVTSPEYLLTEKTLSQLYNVIADSDNIAAIGSTELPEEENGYFQTFNLNPMHVMYNLDIMGSIGGLDEELLLADMAMKDYFFRAALKGFQSVESNIAAVQTLPCKAAMEDWKNECKEHDRKVLKIKWNMNYFNTVPNTNLVSMITCDREANVNILEVGCDCGANLLEIRRLFRNSQLYGVEINEDAATIAAAIFDVRIGNIEEQNLDFGSVKFDYIVFGDVLEHLRAPEKAVAYCRTLLKKGGRIIASIPNVTHHSVLREMLRGNFPYSDSGLLDRTHIHLFAFNDILRLFVNEKYEVESISSITTSIDQEDEKFINALQSISPDTGKHVFTTFQYLISAKYKGENNE